MACLSSLAKADFWSNIADRVMEVQVHLLERFLHVLDLRGTGTDQIIPMPMQTP